MAKNATTAIPKAGMGAPVPVKRNLATYVAPMEAKALVTSLKGSSETGQNRKKTKS